MSDESERQPDTPISPRRLTVPDVTPERLRRLAAEGEPISVERKQEVPDEGLGPTVASFANTLGGWLLLGVDDSGEIVGWEPRAGLTLKTICAT